MAGKFYLWSQTAATNSAADSTINWAEGQPPSSVNDSARAMMAAIASWRDDIQGVGPSNVVLTVGGTSVAYTISSNQVWDQLRHGTTITFKVGSGLTNTGACTLNVDGEATRQIQAVAGTNLTGGELVEGSVYTVTYHQPTNVYMLHNYHGSRGDPVGKVTFYAGSTAPAGWLLCAGQAVSRTTYANLFAAISTTYGPGNGTTTFNVPDIRGRVIAGKDDMDGTSANRLTDQSGGLNGDTLGATGGSETHTLTSAQMPSHTHTGTSLSTNTTGTHTHDIPARRWDTGGYSSTVDPNRIQIGHQGGAVFAGDYLGMNGAGAHSHTISGSTGSAGSGSAHNNVQPTIILNAIIRH